MDRLSKLPDDIIRSILSRLEMRDVVRTTILSKSWLTLWKTIPCLSFEIKGPDVDEIRNFITRVLDNWNGTKVKLFKITSKDFLPSLFDDIHSWVGCAINKKVEELQVVLSQPPFRRRRRSRLYLSLPHSLYSCSSIRRLTLYGCDIRSSSNVGWEHLKSLCIRRCKVGEDMIDRVVSGNPNLETIKVFTPMRPQSVSIESSSLQIVEIGSQNQSNDTNTNMNTNTMLTISAPKLKELTIYGPSYKKCSIRDVFSLTRVELLFTEEDAAPLGETLRQILPSIQHVEEVKLSFYCFKVLMLLFARSLFPFLNVKLLEFYCYYPIELKNIARFLEAFPNLERLILHWYVAYDVRFESWENVMKQLPVRKLKNLRSFLPRLRAVDIVWHVWDELLFVVLESFMRHAVNVEKIVIQKLFGGTDRERQWVRQRLASLQLSFPKVKLILVPEEVSTRTERDNKLPFLVKKLEEIMRNRQW